MLHVADQTRGRHNKPRILIHFLLFRAQLSEKCSRKNGERSVTHASFLSLTSSSLPSGEDSEKIRDIHSKSQVDRLQGNFRRHKTNTAGRAINRVRR
jgi:hypothetical protein